MKRGDVILAFVLNMGSTGKKRPALIVQSDQNNSRLNETIIAAITSNLANVPQAHQLLIELATPEGAATGLLHDSTIRCERLHTIPQANMDRVIGALSDAPMQKINDCLKASLEISSFRSCRANPPTTNSPP